MFLVKYFKDKDDSENLLGEEILKNIEECLLYKVDDEKKIYLTMMWIYDFRPRL